MCVAELAGVGRGAVLSGQLETETIGKLFSGMQCDHLVTEAYKIELYITF